ncbi:hypothetical protein ABW20_dc0104355 [Dactylellina cionopaga]|nr:hypothetical protein ABW20_dc0104355 [Dactylellina cionopaga]
MSTATPTLKNGETFNGDESYPVWPNPRYISRFYVVSSQYSGITPLDTDLFNRCYLPFNPLSYINKRNSKRTNDDGKDFDDAAATPVPNYQIDSPPCKRAAAINSNCYFQNTNGTFQGLQPYEDSFDEQQKCFCEIYPYFDSISGCNECFKDHGGIEDYHWFPETYMSAASSSYCKASPITTGFYPFMTQLSKMNEAAKLPATSTATDVLGTQTAASLYWTYGATATALSNSPSSGRRGASINKLSILLSLAGTVALNLLIAP